MKNLDLKTLLIIALIGIVLIMKMCNKKPVTDNPTVKINGKKYEVIKREIDTQYVPQIKTVSKQGKDIYHDTTIYVPVPTHEPIDTEAILRNFYAKNVFKDTIKLDDSLGFVSVIDTISQNKMYHRDWYAKINKTVITDKIYLKELRNQVYIGGVVGFDKANIINFAGPSMLLKNKKDDIYSIGVGYTNAKTVAIQGGVYWKIKLKK
jgi:hypothetical protein